MFNFERISLEKINIEEYYNFPGKIIFTTIPWIKFVIEDQDAEPVILRITQAGELSGYFTGLLISKFHIRILGSPLKGWSTCFMGFDAYDRADKVRMLPELADFAFRTLKCHYIELIDRDISFEDAKKTGLTFRDTGTLEINTEQCEEAILSSFKTNCRALLRQFEKRGARIEECIPDKVFAHEYYKQLQDVFAKQKLVPTYGQDKVEKLLYNLGPDGMVLCIRVLEPDGRCIASSIFPGYRDKFFFWGGASYRAYQLYRPNEGMFWYGIKYWKAHGAKLFDMAGIRDYKRKYGTVEVHYPCFMIARYSLLLKLRDLAARMYYFMCRVKGFFVKKPVPGNVFDDWKEGKTGDINDT